jgi:hypothetical protein
MTDLFTKNGPSNSTRIERATAEENTHLADDSMRLHVFGSRGLTRAVAKPKIKVCSTTARNN